MRKRIKRLLMKVGLLFVLLPLCMVFNVRAASFDCGNASTKVEKVICADSELSRLDEEMASAYAGASEQEFPSKGLKEQQREWLRKRNRCLDAGCIREQYRQRLDAISKSGFHFTTIYPVDISEFNVDCSKAKSDAEKIICGQASSSSEQRILAGLNRDMLPELQWVLMRSSNKEQLLESQRQWVKEVRNDCMDIGACIRAYNERREELRVMWERPGNCYTLKPLSDGNGHVQLNEQGNIPPIEPVCQAMEKNLNHFCDQPPMACDLKVAPRFQGQITFPDWVQLDPEANLALIEEFIRAPWENAAKEAPQRIWESERPKVEASLAAKRLTLSKAQLDLYNLGSAQLAYRLDFGTCTVDNPQLVAGLSHWRKSITPAHIQIQQAPAIIRLLTQKYAPLDHYTNETFLYGGQTFTYVMSPDGSGDNSLLVNRHERWINPAGDETTKVGLSMHNICWFHYQPIKGGEK